jgi:hypothetical protein
MSMKIEPWPGGRWFHDLGDNIGDNNGHLWGHVQAIKKPTLLEITGSLSKGYQLPLDGIDWPTGAAQSLNPFWKFD